MNEQPIVVADSVSVAQGAMAEFDAGQLQSPAKAWSIIDEVSMLVDPGALRGSVGIPFVELSLECAGQKLTSGYSDGAGNDYVPLPLMSPALNHQLLNFDMDSFATPAIASSGRILSWESLSGAAGVAVAGGYRAPGSVFTWKFPRPMLVPPSTPLVARARRTSVWDTSSVAATVHIAARGRKLLKGPSRKTRCWPFIASWRAQGPTSSQSTVDSGGRPFINPFREPLHLTRINGRMWLYNAGAQAYTGLNDALDSTNWQVAANADLQAPFSIWDADGRPIIDGDQVYPMAAVFFRGQSTVRIEDVLQPQRYYRFRVGGVKTTGAVATAQEPMFAIEGYREVPL